MIEMIDPTLFGFIAYQTLGLKLDPTVLKSAAGYYIGTANESGPVSRESVDYYRSQEEAQKALDEGSWKQRYNV